MKNRDYSMFSGDICQSSLKMWYFFTLSSTENTNFCAVLACTAYLQSSFAFLVNRDKNKVLESNIFLNSLCPWNVQHSVVHKTTDKFISTFESRSLAISFSS